MVECIISCDVYLFLCGVFTIHRRSSSFISLVQAVFDRFSSPYHFHFLYLPHTHTHTLSFSRYRSPTLGCCGLAFIRQCVNQKVLSNIIATSKCFCYKSNSYVSAIFAIVRLCASFFSFRLLCVFVCVWLELFFLGAIFTFKSFLVFR